MLKGDRSDSFLVLPAGQVAISTVISILLSDFTEMTGFGGSKFYVAIKKRIWALKPFDLTEDKNSSEFILPTTHVSLKSESNV